MKLKLLRLPEVLKHRGNRSRASHYRDIQQSLFTKPINIGPRSVAWPAHEVDAINLARLAGKPEQEIKILVKELEAARAAGGEAQ